MKKTNTRGKNNKKSHKKSKKGELNSTFKLKI